MFPCRKTRGESPTEGFKGKELMREEIWVDPRTVVGCADMDGAVSRVRIKPMEG